MKPETGTCPCESGKLYSACCKPLHDGQPAPTAEALMRSRYTAYVLKLENYLLATWHPETRPQALNLDEEPSIKWLGLEVKRAEAEGDAAEVEFVACYRIGGGKAERLHEISRFKRMDNRWYYVTGSFMED
jgi:SEC-C motif-containing protein